MGDDSQTTALLRMPSAPRAVIGTALAYLALGLLGLRFAVGPGYASPVFPAAGLAVAAMLWSGGRAWPGVFLGSVAVNVVAGWQHGEPSLQSLVLALAIAAGSTLQAYVARRLVERHVGARWRTLEGERDVFRCLALAGPLASLVSASVGTLVLHLAGVVPAQGVLFGWWSWWSGDTLGVLVVLPPTLAVLFRRHDLWRARARTVVMPMLLALLVVAGSFRLVQAWERDEQGRAIQRHADLLAGALEQRIIAHQEALAALSRLIEVTADMSAAQFDYYARATLNENPDLAALSSNPYILDKNRALFERTLAAKNDLPAFPIRERDAHGALVPAATRPAYVAVAFIAPREGNEAAFGYDIASEPVRRAAIERARARDGIAATAPVRLVQGGREGSGVLLLQPAHFHGEALDATRRPSLAGFAVAVLRVDRMIDIATRTIRLPGLVFEVEDADADPGIASLYRSEPNRVEPHPPGYLWQRAVAVGDRTWMLSVRPTAEYLQRDQHWTAFGVGVGGVLLSALLQMLLLVSTGRASFFERRVAEQNAELRQQTEALEDRNAQLGAVFGLSPDGFVVFAADGCIRFVNPAFEAMCGLRAEEVVGADAEALLGRLSDRSARADALAAMAPYVRGAATGAVPVPLVLESPRHAVLRVVGIVAHAPGVGRVLYFHEVTREAEVDRIKSEFLSHAAHELRTPLTIILGYSELLLSAERDAATRHELIDAIHRQSQALVGIINELLDLARIEARQGQDINLVRVSLAETVRLAVADLKLPDPRWQLHVDEPLTDLYVSVDPGKLSQALMNVLSNAVKYSIDGGTISIGVIVEADRLGLDVRDRGIGMTPDQLAHYGERFWRADKSGRIAGTGLGVSIVREILALMGGQLEVQSTPGLGTTVTLWLRRADAG